MNKVERIGIAACCPLAAGLLLAACSGEPTETPATQVEELQAVPDDGTDFQAQASIDAEGHVSGRRITRGGGTVVPGFDRSTLAQKPKEPEGPTKEKVAPSLAAKLRPSDPKATTEVLASVAHDAHFSRLAKLRRDQPRTSLENAQRLGTRQSEIAAVDARRKPFRTGVIDRARRLGAVVTEEFTMGNAVAMTIPDSAVAQLAADPDVLEVVARYDGTPPPSTISNGTSLATGMNSDFWRPWIDGSLSFFYAVTFDTGVRSDHTVFNSSDVGTLGLHRDCSRGNITCLNSPFNPAYNDQDSQFNHGTSVASIIIGGNSPSPGFGLPFRGVSKTELDYLNVYSNAGYDSIAVDRAFRLAPSFGDDLIVGELQIQGGEDSPASLSADDAFDQGIAVVAACGNSNTVSSPASPGNAHKALAVGDYDAVSGAVTRQVPGYVNGRMKPDFQAPTVVDAAGNGSSTDKYIGFGGTSGATAFGGGAAALMYEWYSVLFGITNMPGALYTGLLAQGDATTPGMPNGVGKLKMESGSWWWTGSLILGTSAIDRTFPVPAGAKDMKVAIWWPEKQTESHDDVDLRVLAPGGSLLGSSSFGGSVWEKVKQTGNLTAGNYTVRFIPYSMPRPTQLVYYTVIATKQ